MRMLIKAATAIAAIALTTAPAAAQQAIDGTYVDADGYVEIRVAPCGQERCARITRVIRRKPGASMRDENNDDPTLRNRAILGIDLLTMLRWDDGAWRGQVYNPEDGGTYRAVVRPRSNGALEVKGCLSIMCRTTVWPAA